MKPWSTRRRVQRRRRPAGVDPSADADISAYWDFANAVEDAFGVNEITEPVGSFDVVQATDAAKPALESDGVSADGVDDALTGDGSWVDTVFPGAACTIVAGFKVPSAPATNDPPATGYNNEMLLGGQSRLSLFYFTSGAKLGATIFTGSFQGVETAVTLGAWTTGAVRWVATGDIEISLDGVSWATASIGTPALTAVPMDVFKSFVVGVFTEARMSYAAALSAQKSDAEVQAMLAWITTNKLP